MDYFPLPGKARQTDGDIIAKFSRMDSLPIFFLPIVHRHVRVVHERALPKNNEDVDGKWFEPRDLCQYSFSVRY